MDPLERLNKTLAAAGALLDSAASQVRDAALAPTQKHIHSIGEALVAVFEVQHAIYKLKPELEPKHEETSEEERAANRRLGEVLIAAYGLADTQRVIQGMKLLEDFAASEPSEPHRKLAAAERERLGRNYGS